MSRNEVLALKRLPPVSGRAHASLAFTAPETKGAHELQMYLMSSCYLGLDQQYAIPVVVVQEQPL